MSDRDQGKTGLMPTLRFIDVHHHVVLPEYEAALVRSGARDPSKPLRKNTDPAVECQRMAELGIAAAIVNPLSVAGVHHGDDANARYLTRSTNEGLARFISARSHQLGFFATLPLPDVDGALEEMRYAMDELKADGVVFLSNQNGKYIGDPSFEPLYEEMNRRSIVAFIHPTNPCYIEDLGLKLWPTYLEYAFDTTRAATNLIYHEVMRKYPNIKWILAHAGGVLPYLATRLRLIEELEVTHQPPFSFAGAGRPFSERVPEGVRRYMSQFYYDTALAGGDSSIASLREIAPTSHILYGSDCPYIEEDFVRDQNRNLLESRHFTASAFKSMERGNAIGLFPRFKTLDF